MRWRRCSETSNHADVRRSIETLVAKGVITLPQIEEVSNTGPGPKTVKAYLVGKRDSYVVVAQLSPEFTARLVDRPTKTALNLGRAKAFGKNLPLMHSHVNWSAAGNPRVLSRD